MSFVVDVVDVDVDVVDVVDVDVVVVVDVDVDVDGYAVGGDVDNGSPFASE